MSLKNERFNGIFTEFLIKLRAIPLNSLVLSKICDLSQTLDMSKTIGRVQRKVVIDFLSTSFPVENQRDFNFCLGKLQRSTSGLKYNHKIWWFQCKNWYLMELSVRITPCSDFLFKTMLQWGKKCVNQFPKEYIEMASTLRNLEACSFSTFEGLCKKIDRIIFLDCSLKIRHVQLKTCRNVRPYKRIQPIKSVLGTYKRMFCCFQLLCQSAYFQFCPFLSQDFRNQF